jgi:transcriptional regulator with XRE-family HTH domain
MPQREADVYALVAGRVIAVLRERHGLTQEQLAAYVGLTQPTLSRIERGVAHPEPFTIRKMAEAFGMSAEQLTHQIDDAFRRTAALTVQNTAPPLVAGQAQLEWWEPVVAIAGMAGFMGLVALVIGGLAPDSRPAPDSFRPPRRVGATRVRSVKP